jgi:NAD(P)-dependent dehydrogenase (short-subunit alcohol dehydrogenase family)
MFDFSDRVVIITGAAGALGSVTARAFHQAGGRVALVDRNRTTAEKVFGGDLPEGERVLYVTGDLTSEASVAEMVQTTIDYFGRIDVLVNIAGGFAGDKPIHKTSLETWDFLMNLNARSVFLTGRAVIPHLLERKHGRIISVAARAALAGYANAGPYVASKMAVIRLTEAMADELKDHNITANCILPGTIDTPRNRADRPDADFDAWVKPESMANVILFLASDLARDINGAAVPIYGRS